MTTCPSDGAAAARERLSMAEVAARYGYPPNRAGFIRCPFHGERTASLKVYAEPGRGWHCFGCHAGGSVIDWVMRLYGLTFPQALARLDADFGLGLGTSKPPAPGERRQRVRARRAAELAEWEQAREYAAKLAEYRRLAVILDHGGPRTPDEEFSPAYLDAAHRIDALGAWLDEHIGREKVKPWTSISRERTL
mgnify:CR=1 FL=1